MKIRLQAKTTDGKINYRPCSTRNFEATGAAGDNLRPFSFGGRIDCLVKFPNLGIVSRERKTKAWGKRRIQVASNKLKIGATKSRLNCSVVANVEPASILIDKLHFIKHGNKHVFPCYSLAARLGTAMNC